MCIYATQTSIPLCSQISLHPIVLCNPQTEWFWKRSRSSNSHYWEGISKFHVTSRVTSVSWPSCRAWLYFVIVMRWFIAETVEVTENRYGVCSQKWRTDHITLGLIILNYMDDSIHVLHRHGGGGGGWGGKEHVGVGGGVGATESKGFFIQIEYLKYNASTAYSQYAVSDYKHDCLHTTSMDAFRWHNVAYILRMFGNFLIKQICC